MALYATMQRLLDNKEKLDNSLTHNRCPLFSILLTLYWAGRGRAIPH